MSPINQKLIRTKRGDTLIEVMLATAIFSLIAVVSVGMMNSGLVTGERSLERVTARSELNAQAEALRFIHSSYVSELNLPECTAEIQMAGQKCQQFATIWRQIVGNAVSPADYTIEYPLSRCADVYDDSNRLLKNNNAFIINTRQLMTTTTGRYRISDAYLSVRSNSDLFREAPLNARVIFARQTAESGGENNSAGSDLGGVGSTGSLQYLRVAAVEGLWAVTVKGYNDATSRITPDYYDFYIETCWNDTNTPTPTSLDAVIRLYNPDKRN